VQMETKSIGIISLVHSTYSRKARPVSPRLENVHV